MSRRTAEPVPQRIQAEALARELNHMGLDAAVLSARSHQGHPCVQVASGTGQRPMEYVYAAPDDIRPGRGRWWFWWSSLERIAPVTEVRRAAERIAGELARGRRASDEVVWL